MDRPSVVGRWDKVTFIKLVLWVLVLCVILFFAALNLRESVDIRLWWGERYIHRDAPVIIGLGLACLLGIVIYFLVALTRDIRFRAQIGRLPRPRPVSVPHAD